jgi:hypothetical protein
MDFQHFLQLLGGFAVALLAIQLIVLLVLNEAAIHRVEARIRELVIASHEYKNDQARRILSLHQAHLIPLKRRAGRLFTLLATLAALTALGFVLLA